MPNYPEWSMWNPANRNGPMRGQRPQQDPRQIPPGFENMNFQSYDAFRRWLDSFAQQQPQNQGSVQQILGMLMGGGRG